MSLAINPGGRRFTHVYNAAGRLISILSGLGSKRNFTYDATGNLTELIERDNLNSPISTMVDTWDDANRKTVSIRDSRRTTYTYDAGNRLTGQQTSGRWATFSYDSRGNMAVKWHEGSQPMTFTHDAASRITTLQDGPTRITFAYDDNGNMTSEDRGGVVTNYSYDNEDRLIQVTHPDATLATYTYAASGLRRSAHEPGQSRKTIVWDGSDYLQERR